MSEKKGLFSFLNFDSIVENLSGYVEKRIALFKIELTDDLALATARIVIWLILALCFIMAILFISVAGAILLNNILESKSLGFILVSGFYLIIFIILYFLKHDKIEEKLKGIFLEMLNSLDEKNESEKG